MRLKYTILPIQTTWWRLGGGGEFLMPQVGSQSPSHSPPHSTHVPIYEGATAPAPKIAPFTLHVVEDINCLWRWCINTWTSSILAYRSRPPSITYPLNITLPRVSSVLEYTSTRSGGGHTKDKNQMIVEYIAAEATILKETSPTHMSPRGVLHNTSFVFEVLVTLVFLRIG